MPMNYSDLDSLKRHAENFKIPYNGESEEVFREKLAQDMINRKDYVWAQEIRTKKGWDKWNQKEQMSTQIDQSGMTLGAAAFALLAQMRDQDKRKGPGGYGGNNNEDNHI